MPDDIFDFHNGVIDQHTCNQSQGEQGHCVEREAKQIEEPEGWNCRKRNGDCRNDCCAPVAQEQEHHDDGKQCALNHSSHRALILALGVIDAVEQRDEVHAGIFLFNFRDFDHRVIEYGHVGCALGA